jgi:hypothetical protein
MKGNSVRAVIALLGTIGVLVVILALGGKLHQNRPVPETQAGTADDFGFASSHHETPRSGHWPAVEREHLRREPACIVCGHTGKGLNVHHIKSYRLYPALETDDGKDGTGTDGNLATVCGVGGRCRAHYWLAHAGEWGGFNIHLREDAALMRKRWEESKRLAKLPSK